MGTWVLLSDPDPYIIDRQTEECFGDYFIINQYANIDILI